MPRDRNEHAMVSEARANIGTVLIDGRALLIGGPSGSGKSTVARIIAGLHT